MKTLALAVSAAFLSTSALAITIDPDDYAAGTNLSNLVEGVTIAGLIQAPGSSYSPTRGDVFAVACTDRGGYCPAPAGSAAFAFRSQDRDVRGVWHGDAYHPCFSGTGGCQEGFGALEFTFDDPSRFVQATFAFRYDPGLVLAYDSAGNLLEVCGWWTLGNCDGRLTFLGDPETTNLLVVELYRPQADIARLVVAGVEGGAVLNRFRFSRSVPEPGTLGLLALGLVGAWFSRRQKRLTG